MNFGNKVSIFGNAGTGKSTLGRQLSQLLNIPVYHLDRYFWRPNWVERDDEEFLTKINNIRKNEEWIMDGNYLKFVFSERLEESNTIIYLDYNRIFCIYRIIKRYYKNRNKVRRDICTGCYDKLDWSFIKWVWGFKKRVRPNLLSVLDEYKEKGKQIFIFRKKRELKKFMKKRFNVELAQSQDDED